MQAVQAEKSHERQTESRRDRVRRLLIGPLERDGFRKPAKVKADAHAETLVRMADELGYMTDAGLATLRRALEPRGGGKRRDEWPPLATVRGYAELIEPRPLEEVPELLRWFRSVEGPRAVEAGTLVETWDYWRRRKRPPVEPGARRQVAEAADENRRRLRMVAERERDGRADDADLAWRDRYLAEERRIAALVGRLRAEATPLGCVYGTEGEA